MKNPFPKLGRKLRFLASERFDTWFQLRAGRRKIRVRSLDTYPSYDSNLATTSRFLGIDLGKKIMQFQKKRGGTLNVLEIGCGEGETLRDLQRIEGLKLHGTNLKREKGFESLNADVRIAHIGQLEKKFGPNSMGFVFASNVIGHASPTRNNFEQIYRILEPGGRLVFNLTPYFAKSNVVSTLRETGFKVFKTKSHEVTVIDKGGKEIKRPLFRYYAEKPAQAR